MSQKIELFIADKSPESVKMFRYLGMAVTNQNIIQT
jgi:hypothetical protein